MLNLSSVMLSANFLPLAFLFSHIPPFTLRFRATVPKLPLGYKPASWNAVRKKFGEGQSMDFHQSDDGAKPEIPPPPCLDALVDFVRQARSFRKHFLCYISLCSQVSSAVHEEVSVPKGLYHARTNRKGINFNTTSYDSAYWPIINLANESRYYNCVNREAKLQHLAKAHFKLPLKGKIPKPYKNESIRTHVSSEAHYSANWSFSGGGAWLLYLSPSSFADDSGSYYAAGWN